MAELCVSIIRVHFQKRAQELTLYNCFIEPRLGIDKAAGILRAFNQPTIRIDVAHKVTYIQTCLLSLMLKSVCGCTLIRKGILSIV
jgi:hypothetical protein